VCGEASVVFAAHFIKLKNVLRFVMGLVDVTANKDKADWF
jgi:hypothetical protein